MTQPNDFGVFLSTALLSMALVTIILGFLNPEERISLLIALVISGALVTGGYWAVKHLRGRHSRRGRRPQT